MIEYTQLSTADYSCFKANINGMNTMVFEDLYCFYYEVNNAPQEYHANNLYSPREATLNSHNKYFPKYIKIAKELFIKWEPKLHLIINTEADQQVLNQLERSIYNAKDFIYLTWAIMQLLALIAPYVRNGKFSAPGLAA